MHNTPRRRRTDINRRQGDTHTRVVLVVLLLAGLVARYLGAHP